MRRCRRWASRCFNVVEADAEHPGDQLQPDVLLAVLLWPGVGGDRLAASLGELPVLPHLVDQCVGEALLVGGGRRCGSARLAGHDQAEDPVLAAQPLECEDLLVHPARLCGCRRTDNNLKRGLLQRSSQGLTKICGRRELVAVAEHRGESLGHGTVRGLSADEMLRHAVGLERLVQPLGPALVAMAVTDKSAVLKFGIHSSRSKRTAGGIVARPAGFCQNAVRTLPDSLFVIRLICGDHMTLTSYPRGRTTR